MFRKYNIFSPFLPYVSYHSFSIFWCYWGIREYHMFIPHQTTFLICIQSIPNHVVCLIFYTLDLNDSCDVPYTYHIISYSQGWKAIQGICTPKSLLIMTNSWNRWRWHIFHIIMLHYLGRVKICCRWQQKQMRIIQLANNL